MLFAELTQEDTLQFDPKREVTAQINWIDANGKRQGTKPKPVKIYDNNEPYVLPPVPEEEGTP